MKYINGKFYKELENEKYIIHDRKIMFETKMPKSLKTRYEFMFDTKLTKTQTVVELDDGTLQLLSSQELKPQNQKKYRRRKNYEICYYVSKLQPKIFY